MGRAVDHFSSNSSLLRWNVIVVVVLCTDGMIVRN